LDGWLSMIIYPSLEVKRQSFQHLDGTIRKQINRIKSERADRVNEKMERVNWTIELTLDDCRTF
jgi:hypothetical protein